MRLNSDVEFKTWWNSKFAVKKTVKAQNENQSTWHTKDIELMEIMYTILYLNKADCIETEFKIKISLKIHRQSNDLY